MNPKESELSLAKQHWDTFVGRRENHQKNSARVALAVAYWRESCTHFNHKRSFRGWVAAYYASSWAVEAISVAAMFYDRECPGSGQEGFVMIQEDFDAIIDILSAPWYLGGNYALAERLSGAKKTFGFMYEF